MTTIDVSTPEARQDIVGDIRAASKEDNRVMLWKEGEWLHERSLKTIEAAFARIDELEALARDLAKELMEHRGPHGDPIFDRARSAGVLP